MKILRPDAGVALAGVVALGVLGGACTAFPVAGSSGADSPRTAAFRPAAGGRSAAAWAGTGILTRAEPGGPAATGTPDGPPAGDDTGTPAAPPAGGAPAVPVDVAAWRARLPRFGPAPAARPVPLPDRASAAVVSRVPTSAPVAFLTIDDGQVRRPEALPMLRAAGIPVTLFLIGPVAAQGYPYFAGLAGAGAVIEAHTQSHPQLAGKSYEFQRREICGSADELGRLSGRRPLLFRPPYGSYDATTLRAAHDCGMRAVVVWTEAARNGHVVYQTPEHVVHPGDVILMHFRDRYADDFRAALVAIHRSGLTPALLEDYLTPPVTRHASFRPAA